MHRTGPDELEATEVPPSERCIEGRLLAGRYLIGPLLGSGAMGRVHVATHVELGRTCAVKLIREDATHRGEAHTRKRRQDAIARFRIEALAASRLDHPNVLRVLDFGRDPEVDLWYLVTEHLDGSDLVDVLAAEQLLETQRTVAIARQVCSALQHAHDRGVVHRDIKPENVRLVGREADDGHALELVKVLDFGTAKIVADDDASRADARMVIGTPAYMSPEQASGDGADARSDLYSCGVMLFEMATGRLPFERASPIALAAAHVECRPPAPSSIHEGIDPELESIILWCLRKKPAERPQSARELREALERFSSRAFARKQGLPEAAAPRRRPRAAQPHRAAESPPPALADTAPTIRELRPAHAARRRLGLVAGALALAATLAGSAWILFDGELPAGIRARQVTATPPSVAAPRPAADPVSPAPPILETPGESRLSVADPAAPPDETPRASPSAEPAAPSELPMPSASPALRQAPLRPSTRPMPTEAEDARAGRTDEPARARVPSKADPTATHADDPYREVDHAPAGPATATPPGGPHAAALAINPGAPTAPPRSPPAAARAEAIPRELR